MIDIQEKRKAEGRATGTDRRPAAVTGAPLGIVTKTASPLQYVSINSTAEAIPVEQQKDGSLRIAKLPEQARAERWALKSVVNKLLPYSRTSKCMVFKAPVTGEGLSTIQVHVATEHNKAFYTGLMACGSVWSCPVCAAKISERRRQELIQGMEAARSLGWQAHFVTLTVRHGIGDNLQDMKQRMSKALRLFNSGKNRIKDVLLRNGIDQKGYVRAYEITHGQQSGFHPHYHIILFTVGGTSQQIQRLYAPLWQKACVSAGLSEPTLERGCTVQDGSEAAKYASKWGIEDELTKANQKQSKRKGITPWGLLRAVLDENNPEYSPQYASDLFRVYTTCMKGARQLYWSNGLRKALGLIQELTDEQLAEQITDEDSHFMGALTDEQWKAIRKAKAEAHVLTVAEAAHKTRSNYFFEVVNGYVKRMPKETIDYSLTDKENDFFAREVLKRNRRTEGEPA